MQKKNTNAVPSNRGALRRGIAALLVAAVLLLSSPVSFAAGRTDEEDFEPVAGGGNWEHTIDVSELEPGKYNILVRARDKAGNEALGGPYNVFVDPASDQPLVSISYPVEGQPVGERLYVIGTAADDDAVTRVEISVDDGAPITAQGGDYWSAFVSMNSLDDGPHTITATAFDEGGTAGEPVTVSVRLDTKPPQATSESHESGVLISRRTTVSGVVEDSNGVAKLELLTETDAEQLRLRGRDAKQLSFEFRIDPEELDEAAHVWWLRTTDSTGAVGTSPFLFFVDTSPPELEIISPEPGAAVDGSVDFVGRVFDAVGIERLAYELSNGESGEIDLVPGDPYWHLNADFGPDPGRSITAEFRVEDVAGNAQDLRLRLSPDAEADAPVVLLRAPGEEAIVDAATLVGHIADDDGAAMLRYSVDGGEPVEVASEGAFVIPLADLSPGPHEIRLRAIDVAGREGEELRRRFSISAAPVSIALESVLIGEQTQEYQPGFAIPAGARATLVGAVQAGEDSAPLPSRLQYRVGATFGRANIDESGGFQIGLPRGEVGAALPIDVWHTNATGRVSRAAGFVIQLPAVQAAEGEAAREPTIEDILATGLYLGPEVAVGALDGVALTPEQEAALAAPILLPPGGELALRAVGGNPSDPQIARPAGGDGESATSLSLATRGELVTISASLPVFARDLAISAQLGGRSVSATEFALAGELAAPQVTVDSSLNGARLAEERAAEVEITDPAGIQGAQFRLVAAAATAVPENGGSEPPWRDLRSLGDDRYAIDIPSDGGDGPTTLEIQAVDASGVAHVERIPLFVDTTAPTIALVTPPEGAPVNGIVTIVGRLSEPSTTTSVTAVIGDERRELEIAPTVSTTIAAGDGLDSVTFEMSDAAGNTSSQVVSLAVDDSADRPTLQVQVPTEGGVVHDRFQLSGVLLDDDEPQAVRYSVDGGEPVEVPTSGVFDVNIPMDSLDDGDHTLLVTGVDRGGTESEAIERIVAVSRTEPVSAVVSPTIDEYVSGTVMITGSSEDPNGIDRVAISTDNGASFQNTRGEGGRWRYELDTTQLADGTHSLLIRATDGAQSDGLFTSTINVDNTPPLVELTQPEDGSSVSGDFLIDGRSGDPALAEVRIIAEPLLPTGDEAGGQAPAGGRIVLATFDTEGPFAYSVDTTTIQPGWFNLRVEAQDEAGNTQRVSRNIRVLPPAEAVEASILSPMDGAELAHQFTITVSSPQPATPLTLLLDGRPLQVITTDESGNGSFVVEAGTITEGEHEIAVLEQSEAAEAESNTTRISYSELGPWVMIDEPLHGAYVRDRPFLTGRAGYALELAEGEDRETRNANEDSREEHAVERIEVSTDNGRSYTEANGREQWRYRIETTEIPDGPVHLLVRARFADGSSAVSRHKVYVDETQPEVRLLEPQERDRFDEEVPIVGVSTDENGLEEVAVVLRSGDKSRYSVPSFIQGLYVDAHGFGATYFDVGAGLTFFDDNVRLQAQIGISPPGRFSGLVIGAKLLANVFSFPASFLFGPDLDWLSAAIAIGANFSYFTMSEDTIAFTPEGLVLAGMVAQLEFPRVTLASMPVFNTFGFYTEGQLWFISSDVEAGTAFRLGFGLRMNVF